MAKIKFNAPNLKAINPNGTRLSLYDTETRGLCLRLEPSGRLKAAPTYATSYSASTSRPVLSPSFSAGAPTRSSIEMSRFVIGVSCRNTT